MAKKILGYTIEIGGETTKLDKALSKVESSSKGITKELSEVNKALRFDPKNTTLLTQKQALLSKEIGNTKERLDVLKEAAKQANEQLERGEITQEQFRATQREVETTESRLKYLQTQADKTEQALSGWTTAQENLQSLGDKTEKVGQKLSLVSAGIGAAAGAAVKVTSDFDSSMSQVAAISGASADEMENLRAKAREMGAQTKFSASEAGDAMSYMAMAGWKADDMIDGIGGTMNLAAASGEDLATTSDILTDGLTAFGMSADEAGRMADVMAAASSNANTNVSMLGESFKYVAPVAGSMGYNVEDVSLALGLMANSGVKASAAGTALRTLLTNLAKPTDAMAVAMDDLGISLTDGEGNMKSLQEIMGDMRGSFANLTEDQKASYAATIAGKEGMSGLLAIVNASEDDYNKLAGAIENSNGAAEKMATIMQDNLEGQWTILKSELEELGISVGEILMPSIRGTVEQIQKFVDWLNSLSPAGKKAAVGIGAAVAAIGPLLIAVGKMEKGASALIKTGQKVKDKLNSLKSPLQSLTGSTGSAATKTGLLTGNMGLLAGGLAGVAAACIAAGAATDAYVKNLEAEKIASDASYAGYKDMTKAAQDYKAAVDEHTEAGDKQIQTFESSQAYADRLTDSLSDLIEKEELSAAEKLEMKDAVDRLNEVYPDLGWSFDENTGQIQTNTGEIINNTEELKANLEQAKTNAREKAYLDAIQEYTTALTNSQLAYADAADATEYYRGKLDETEEKMEELRAAGQTTSDEYKQLAQDQKLYSDSWQESSRTLEGLHQSMGDSFENLLIAKNKMETGGLDTIGESMIKSLDEAIKKASDAGFSIPDNLIAGIKNGETDVREAAGLISALMNFQEGVDNAGKFGGQIPAELAYQMLANTADPEEAAKKLNELIDFADAMEATRKAGEEIPAELAALLEAGNVPIEEKMQALKQWVLDGSQETKGSVTQNASDTMENVETAISDSDADTRADSKAKAIYEGLTRYDPADPTARTMGGLSAAIRDSDADSQADSKGTAIYNGLDFSGASNMASDTVGSINGSLDNLTTYKEINIALRSSWAGAPGNFHAEGGIFRKATLIPSLKGRSHVVGEGGQAEAILPLTDFYNSLDSAVASAMQQSRIEVQSSGLNPEEVRQMLGKLTEISAKLEALGERPLIISASQASKAMAPSMNKELHRLGVKR